MHGSLSDEDVDRTIARLTRRVNQLQSTVAALLAERNRAEVAAREAASSALAGVAPDGPSHAAATLLRCVIDSLEGRMCILAEDGTLQEQPLARTGRARSAVFDFWLVHTPPRSLSLGVPWPRALETGLIAGAFTNSAGTLMANRMVRLLAATAESAIQDTETWQ